MLLANILFSLENQSYPQYLQYRTNMTIRSPWGNNTQTLEVAYDSQSQRLKYAAKNGTDQVCDYSLMFADSYLYGRTVNHQYQCSNHTYPFSESYRAFVPILENFTLMGQEMLMGTLCRHYRLITENQSNQTDVPYYNGVTVYQSDFYCAWNNKTQQCTPIRYYQSWFYYEMTQQNKDQYIMDYQTFQFFTLDSDFDFDFYGIKECQYDPLPPQYSFSPLSILTSKNKTHMHRNLALISKTNGNNQFTFKTAPNRFVHHDLQKLKPQVTGQKKLKNHEWEKIYKHYNLSEDQKQFLRGPPGNFTQTYLTTPYIEDLPTNFDWRTHGVINPVKDQLYCGSCWIFSSVGAVEAAINIARQKTAIASQPLISIAEQQVVDCFWNYSLVVNLSYGGCQGGDNDPVLSSFVGRTTLPTEQSYPYLALNDWCKENNVLTGINITGFYQVPPFDIIQMKRAVYNNPVSVFTATPDTFMFYVSGIYNDPACGALGVDHSVLIVGWGESQQGPYWVVRNSWGPEWGTDGYVYIAMKGDMCGLLGHGGWVTAEILNSTE